jgi:CheY-like chemotaxis protein
VGAAIEQVRPLIDARRHALRTRLPAHPLWVRGDRTRLTQILTNLLNNGAKYTPEGGELDLQAGIDGEHVVLQVHDTGQGIEPGLLPQIFDLFTQAERSPDRTQGGLGIGLALVRSLVSLHGGSISADSPGRHRGATFTVRLPRVAAPAEEGVPAPGAAAHGEESLDIVIVDDNVDAARSLQVLLQAYGHRVRVYHCAREALQALLAQPSQVAFLDIGLPDMTGHELAREIRARLGSRAGMLAALSGYGRPQDFAASNEAGLDCHLVKPPELSALLGVLARAGTRPVLDAR